MDTIDRNKELWGKDRLLHNLKYPDENVVRFLYHLRALYERPRVLDFGCGSGRNTLVMRELGFDICAMDYNSDCLNLTKAKLNNYERIEYVENKETALPTMDNHFDGIVAWGALFYLNRNSERVLIEELVRTLRKGGILLADYRAKDDSLYGRGAFVEPDMFILDNTCGSLSGISYAFRDYDEIKQLYREVGLCITNYEKIDHYIFNGDNTKNSHHIVWAKKE